MILHQLCLFVYILAHWQTSLQLNLERRSASSTNLPYSPAKCQPTESCKISKMNPISKLIIVIIHNS